MIDSKLNEYIQLAANTEGVDPNLLRAMIMSESSGQNLGWHGKPNHSGYGFGGLIPSTAQQMGVDYTKPDQNVLGVARYIKYINSLGVNDPTGVAASYKAGPNAWRKNPNLDAQEPWVKTGVNRVMQEMNRPAPAQAQTTPPPAPPAATQAPDKPLPPLEQTPKVDRTKDMPERNPELRKMLEEWGVPKGIADYAGRNAGTGGAVWPSFANAGAESGLRQLSHYRDAQDDRGQQLGSLISLLIGNEIGGARSRKRIK